MLRSKEQGSLPLPAGMTPAQVQPWVLMPPCSDQATSDCQLQSENWAENQRSYQQPEDSLRMI